MPFWLSASHGAGYPRQHSKTTGLDVFATSEDDEADALAQLKLKMLAAGRRGYLFNYLGKDSELPVDTGSNSSRSRLCDLQSAGYRIINRI